MKKIAAGLSMSVWLVCLGMYGQDTLMVQTLSTSHVLSNELDSIAPLDSSSWDLIVDWEKQWAEWCATAHLSLIHI